MLTYYGICVIIITEGRIFYLHNTSGIVILFSKFQPGFSVNRAQREVDRYDIFAINQL